MDRALKAFEYTTEWADLIAALGKLNKVLLAHMKYPIIPRRIVISKVRRILPFTQQNDNSTLTNFRD